VDCLASAALAMSLRGDIWSGPLGGAQKRSPARLTGGTPIYARLLVLLGGPNDGEGNPIIDPTLAL
jgi:hypothetical protein